MTSLLTVLTSVGVGGSLKFIIFTSTFTEKRAKKINTFIKTLISGKWDANKLEPVIKFMAEFTKVLKSLSIILVITTALVAFAPITAVIGGFILMRQSVKFIKNIITDLVSKLHKKDTEKANNIIHSITKLILTIGGVLALVSLLTVVVGPGPVLLGFALIGLLLQGTTKVLKQLLDKKIKDNLKNASAVLKNISILILSATLSIAAITLLIENTKIENVVLGFVIVGAMITGAYFLIKKLSNIKSEELKYATTALFDIAKTFAIMTVTALLFSKIGKPKNLIATVLGAAIVTFIVYAGIRMVMLLTEKVKKKDLKEARITLLTLAGLFAGISLISLFILKPLGENANDAFLGAGIVLGILGLLIGGVWLLSKITKKNTLKSGLTALTALIVMYTALALLIRFIIVPMGNQASEAFLGSVITLGVLAGLIGGIWLLSQLDVKNVLKGLAYTAVLAVIYLGISLIVKQILIPIGEEWKAALTGTAITLGILVGLIAGVWILSKVKGKNILFSVLAVAGLAVILLGISLIVKELLIPIG